MGGIGAPSGVGGQWGDGEQGGWGDEVVASVQQSSVISHQSSVPLIVFLNKNSNNDFKFLLDICNSAF